MTTEDKNMEVQILETAEKLFLEQGFAKTTMSQIANEVGCNKALVHYYYRSKDKLFDRIFEEKAKFLLNNLLNSHAEGETFADKLAMKIRGHFDFLKENPKIPAFLFNELSTNPDRMKSFVEKIIAQFHPLEMLEEMNKELQEEIMKGNIRPVSIIDLLISILCLNITPFLVKPFFLSLYSDNQQIDLFFENRKEETKFIRTCVGID